MRKRLIVRDLIVLSASLLIALQARGACQSTPLLFDTTVWMDPDLPWWPADCNVAPGCDFGDGWVWFRYQPHAFDNYDEDWCDWPTVPQASQPEPPEPSTAEFTEAAYIFKGAIANVTPNYPPAKTGDLYVGGYSHWYYDANDGLTPQQSNDYGELRIFDGGSLKVSGCQYPGNDTDCYERVGYNGGRGKVVQEGGIHTVPNSISFGMSSECVPQDGTTVCIPCAPDDDGVLDEGDQLDAGDVCSEGTYEFNGGDLIVGSLDIGVQGKGTFTMTGGKYRSTINPEHAGGTSWVGRTYDYPDPGIPPLRAGIGRFTQSGGEFKQGIEFSVGAGPRAWGHATISDDPNDVGVTYFSAIDLVAGHNETLGVERDGGTGTIVQEGGIVQVNRHLMLGESPNGRGRYEIKGGTLRQISNVPFYLRDPNSEMVLSGVYVGVDHPAILVNGELKEIDEGHGELTVVGKESTIEIGGVYVQGSDSVLTAELEESSPHISMISVQGVATFAAGARVKVELPVGWSSPTGIRVYPILTAQRIDGFEGVVKELPMEANVDWFLEATGNPPNMLVARSEAGPACGLLGIEPVLAMGLLHARRRMRRSSKL